VADDGEIGLLEVALAMVRRGDIVDGKAISLLQYAAPAALAEPIETHNVVLNGLTGDR